MSISRLLPTKRKRKKAEARLPSIHASHFSHYNLRQSRIIFPFQPSLSTPYHLVNPSHKHFMPRHLFRHVTADSAFLYPSKPGSCRVHGPSLQPEEKPAAPALLVVEIRPDRALQLAGTLTNHVGQVFQIVSSCDSKLAHKILGSRLEVTIVLNLLFLLPSKVGIRGDGRGSLESLESRLGFGLSIGVVGALAKVLVGGDGLLRAKLAAGERF